MWGNRDELKKAGVFYPQFVYIPEKENCCNHSGPLSMIYKRGIAKSTGKKSKQKGRSELRQINQEIQIKALR